MKLGVYILGIATIAAGVFDFIWGEFEPAHQPIQAWGDHIPGQQILAHITAAWLVAAGAAILWRRTERAGAIATGLVYLVFAVFWLPRLYTAPRVLGFHIALCIGLLAGLCTQLIVVAAAVIVYASAKGDGAQRNTVMAGRVVFGISSLAFGLAHLTGVNGLTRMIPEWMPFGASFWVVLTGIAFVLAGLAILSMVLAVLAARLLALMLFMFSVVALVPNVIAAPHQHVPWGSNAYNLAAVGAVWIFAASLVARRKREMHARTFAAEP